MDDSSSIESNDCDTGIANFYSGFLTPRKSFLSRLLFGRYISRVTIAQEYVDALKELSQKGMIVFAQKNKSQLNCLIMSDVFHRTLAGNLFCHGINMSFWQPLSVNLKVFLTRLFHFFLKRNKDYADQHSLLKEVDKNKGHSVIYLRGSEFLSLRPTKDPIVQLIHARKGLERPVYIVPVMVSYGRRREKAQKTFLEILLGMKENPGMLRRTITFLRHSKKGKILCSKPVDLSEILEKNKGKSLETISYNIRRELIERIDNEKRIIFGPVLKSRDELMETVLRDTYMIKWMEEAAVSGPKNFKTVTREAKKYLHEIAADFNEIYIEIFYKLLTWLWNNIYDGIVVDSKGLAEVKEISKRMPFVIIPCHRSHIDYLLLHYVMELNAIQLPFIAAGANLNIWPLGTIFRNCGAFFIRRSMQGQDLYQAVLSKYLKVLLKEGFPLEFFIEGGRSRTGKMVMPKYGLLSMIIQAYQEGISDDLALIPVYIGYDKIIEEKAYLQELGGAPKKPEKILDLLKTSNILRKRFGSVYVNIGEPILLKSYMASLEKPYDSMVVEERQRLYREIGHEIVTEINKTSVITPFSLTACGLLCHYRRGIAHKELMAICNAFYDWLSHNGAKFAATFANKERAIEDALGLIEQYHLMARMGIEEEDQDDDIEEIVYSVPDEKRPNLEYYKNNILHFFTAYSFVATSILSCREDSVPRDRIMDDYRFFKDLFKNEFIFDEQKSDSDKVEDILNYMHKARMINGRGLVNETLIEVSGKGRINMRPFAGLIHNYIESYWVVIRGCSYLKKNPRPDRDFVKKVQMLGTRMYKKGEITRSEALSSLSYQNAIKFLVDSGVLKIEVTKDKKKDRETKLYALAADKEQIDMLRQRLFKFL